MHRYLTIIALAIAAVAAPAVASPNVHAGDKLNVLVYNHPELTTQTVVDATGHITIPLAGDVVAAQQSPAELAARIRERLLPFVKQPAVDVQVLQQSSSIFVSGGPGGVLTYAPGETLTNAVVQALQQLQARTQVTPAGNTVTPQSIDTLRGPVDLHTVRIVRDGRTLGPYDVGALVTRGEAGPALEPGDTIGLAEKPVAVKVYGAVNSPGIAHLDRDEPLQNALAQAGGVEENGSRIAMNLVRNGKDTRITTTSPEYNAPAQNGDVIEVPRALKVAVVGNVMKPGDVELRGDSSLISALFYAGGPAATGDLRNVQVVHDGRTVAYDVTTLTKDGKGVNPVLADGDTVFVPAGKQKIDFGGIFRTILAAPYYLLKP